MTKAVFQMTCLPVLLLPPLLLPLLLHMLAATRDGQGWAD
jgi:hypothetical protein